MTKSDDKRVPTLRFKGFTDEWEQRKLKNLVDFYSGLTYHPENIREKGTFVIRSSNIKDGQLVTGDNIFVAPEIVNSTYVKKDDIIVVVRNGSRKLIGKHTKLNFNLNNAVIGAFMTGIRSNNNNFINAIFDSDNFKREIHKNLGATINQITTGELKRMNFYIPSLTSEQNYLGNLMKVLDKLITLQQRKLNDLSSMKSALLQNIFPNTQGIKKIKLSTQEWNLQKISSIFKERNQRNKNGMLLSVSISKGVYPFSENDRKDNSSNDKRNYKEVKINDLAYNSMRMWQGAVGVSKYNGIVSPAYTVITPKKEENPNFYYYYFKNKRMLFNFRQHSQGLTSDTWNLKFPLFEKILIQVPSDKEEEQRISSLFKQLDKSIDLNKIHIEKLTSIKQFLLQNMFI